MKFEITHVFQFAKQGFTVASLDNLGIKLDLPFNLNNKNTGEKIGSGIYKSNGMVESRFISKDMTIEQAADAARDIIKEKDFVSLKIELLKELI